jgi:hypothetical protein
MITESRPFTKNAVRTEGAGGGNLDENKNYMNLEEHSRMTENEDGTSSVGKMAESSKDITFKTSRPHHKGVPMNGNSLMNNTVLSSFAAAMNRSGQFDGLRPVTTSA